MSGYLPDTERKTIDLTAQFCEENRLDSEIIDLANVGFVKRVKLFLAGERKVPVITFREENFTELSSIEKDEKLYHKNNSLCLCIPLRLHF